MKNNYGMKERILSYLFMPLITFSFSPGCSIEGKNTEEIKSKEVIEQLAGNLVGYSIEIPRMINDWIFDNSPEVKEDEFYIDLHCHWDIKKNISELEEDIEELMKRVDIIGVTGRGIEENVKNYISDYEIIKNKLSESDRYKTNDSGNVLEVKGTNDILYLVKSQEIKTSNGIEVVSVGCSEDFYEKKDLETTLDNINKEGFAFLPHPVLIAKNHCISFQPINRNEKEIIESLKDKYVALEGYNSNNPFNASSIIIAKEFDEPFISNSDSHYDTETAALCGIITDRKNINTRNGEEFIDSLKKVILEEKYRNHCEYNSPEKTTKNILFPIIKRELTD